MIERRKQNANDYSESLLVHFRRLESLRQSALALPSLDLSDRQQCDLELLLNRAFYPLSGYLNRGDYESVLTRMRLGDGSVWPIPICLDVAPRVAESLQPGTRLALNDREGVLLAILTVGDIWQADKKREALAVYGSDDPARHPGVRQLLEETGVYYIGGALEGLHLPIHYDFQELRITPSESHRLFAQNGWRQVIGFHTHEYLHCAEHDLLRRAAREVGASIFLQPVVGLAQPGNLDHYSHVRCYQEFANRFPKNTIMLGLTPLASRQAGPREALWQAIIKKNYGCSHFMVSDNHGDPFAERVGEEWFYPPHAAQELVREFEPETGIAMLPWRKMVYVENLGRHLPADEVEAGMEAVEIAPAELRRRLACNEELPPWFSYPEVLAELKRAYPPRNRQGFTVFLTGLSGSGKSTLAKVLVVKFMERRERPVTLLDGDIVRKNLSSELDFSRAHRDLNITRIGFVASEITKNGGIAICAPIAPYERSRRANRELISRYGGYIEVFVATPVEVCEQRDRKGLYAKARAGTVAAFTGVSDPYEKPLNPEVTIDTSLMSPMEAAQEVLLYLQEHGYLE